MARNIKTNHERKVNYTHAWQRGHGALPKPKAPGVRAASIPDKDVASLAVDMSYTSSPTSDLVRLIEKTFGCSAAVAGKVYSRLLDQNLIAQYENPDRPGTYRWVKHLTNDQLDSANYEVCEFGGDCDKCEKEFPEGELFFHRTSYEYLEGDYCCRKCAAIDIEEDSHLGEDYD